MEIKKLEALLNEVKGIKHCLLAGWYEKGYELTQNVEDELTTLIIKTNEKTTNEKAPLLPPQSNEADP